MEQFPLIVTPPPAADKKLNSQHQQLSSEAARLGQVRTDATAQWKTLAARAVDAREAVAVPLRVQMLELEIGVLSAEVPVLQRLPEYLQAVRALRLKEVAVVQEMIPLAEAHVTAIFHRDFPPERWPSRPGALAYHVANHPIVLGARDRLAEIDQRHEQDLLEPAKTNAQRAEARLAQATRDLPAAKERAATLKAQEDAAAEQQATAQAAGLKRQQEQEAAQKKAADEARKRLSA